MHVLRRLRFCARCFALVMVFSGLASAQEFWVNKDYLQWSAPECQKLLTDSWWSKTASVGAIFALLAPGEERFAY